MCDHKLSSWRRLHPRTGGRGLRFERFNAVGFLKCQADVIKTVHQAMLFESIDFEIIFVTAYDQFAIKAFELAAIDYLLKPILKAKERALKER